jgi:hypothetical protein
VFLDQLPFAFLAVKAIIPKSGDKYILEGID